MKALVISGGGSKGAFAGGIAEYLIKEKGNKYDLFVGTSVGSLIVSQLALQKVDYLKTVLTTITNKDVFSISPFKVRNKNGKAIVSINHFNTLRAFIKGCSTFGESKQLRKMIRKMITHEEFKILKETSHVVFTVSNLTKQKVEYIDSNDCNYDDFCDYMWASANVVPFMSLLNKNDCQYADGGFGMHVPVLYAIENGAIDIDVIDLKNESLDLNGQLFTNPFQSLMGVFNFMSNQIASKDMVIGKLKGRQNKIDVKIWSSKNNITDNSLYFNPSLMKEWWANGFYYAKTTAPICHCFMPDETVNNIKI